MSSSEAPRKVPGVNISGSQGAQAGTGNVQFNSWTQKQPPDPVALKELNPHTAVARLQKLTHDELVDFFARAKPGDVSEIFRVFVETDHSKIVAALGDINRRKATELISAGGNFFDDLPEAAEAIDRKAASLRWTDVGTLKAFFIGYTRKYRNGHIFWSGQFGSRTTVGAIDDCIKDVVDDNPWSIPTGDQEIAAQSPFGTTGVRQKFRKGIVYSSGCGTFLVAHDHEYNDEGGSAGWLGFPASGEEPNGQFGNRQMFEGGAMYSYGVGLRSFTVRREVMSFLPDQGWRPVSQETRTMSSYGALSIQRFEVELKSGTYETAVYWDKDFSSLMIAPEVWDYYSKFGAEKSWLGLPVDSPKTFLRSTGEQQFEQGTIYWLPDNRPHSVSNAVGSLIEENHARLGYPVSEEEPAGADGSGRIQYFRNGVVTLRDGKYEIWVRLNATAEPTLIPELPVGKDDETGEAAREAQRQAAKSEMLRWSTAAIHPKWRPDIPDSQG